MKSKGNEETAVGPRVGILPLYLALYDDVVPENRPGREAFARRVAERLAERGLEVELGGVCCVADEVREQIEELKSADVDLLLTLHLAYSPSLESAQLLSDCGLPLLLLDTTEKASFDEEATQEDMFANHGIHGVQDLASVLRSMGRGYFVAAGHVDDESLLDDVVGTARAAAAARGMRRCRTVLIGEPFAGMGDFAVHFEALQSKLGPEVRSVTLERLAARTRRVDEEELAEECRLDEERFDTEGLSEEVLCNSNRVGLALRKILEEESAQAFTMNFQAFGGGEDAPTVPFLEASKAMARGIGYAGEGDVLTASFAGAIMGGLGPATFTEMFCPDWQGEAVFLSHMGECNVALAAGRPRLVEKDYAFGDVPNPAVPVFSVEPGEATLANIAKTPGGGFSVIASTVEVLERGPAPGFRDVPHFWVRPDELKVADFLRIYSEWGGTHHLVLMPGRRVGELARMCRMLGVEAYYLGV